MAMRQRVVVTGIGIVCGLGNGKAEVADRLLGNQSGILEVTRFDTRPFISKYAAEVKDFACKEELKACNPCIQYAAYAIEEAMADSGIVWSENVKERTGIAFGTCNGGLTSFEAGKTLVDLSDSCVDFPLFQQSDITAAAFGLGGPVLTNTTACAASGNAIGFASDLVAEGYADLMIAGGSDSLAESVFAGFHILQALSPEPCSPFDAQFGLSLGEGAAFVVLESLDNALARGAHIYAELCGYGLSQDAFHITAPQPEGAGIAAAVTFALGRAGVPKESIDYVNVHGTGTQANDAAELRGLRQAFEQHYGNVKFSSGKAHFGHNLGAAAAIEFVTTLIAVEWKMLPPTLHFRTPREGCEDAGLIANEALPSKTSYFLCNNSGFGGHNSSIVSRVWERSDLDESVSAASAKRTARVAVVGIGLASAASGCMQGGSDIARCSLSNPLDPDYAALKEYIKPFYTRRMNRLTQYGVGAAHLAMVDAGLSTDSEDGRSIGLLYGTTHSTLDSFTKYMEPIFTKGPEFANALYFPDTVHNSTPGKIATCFGLKGYGSSFSTGGNDGLLACWAGYELVKSGEQSWCLTGAGEELSPLSAEMNRVLGLHEGRYPISDGSCFLMLADSETAAHQGRRRYADLLGFGMAFGGRDEARHTQAYRRAIEDALMRAGTAADEISHIYWNDCGLSPHSAIEQSVLEELFGHSADVISLNDAYGYSLSVSPLIHLAAAAEQLSGKPESVRALVVSSSLNGNCAAAVLSGGGVSR